ncbi:MAG: MFS transporter [Pseudomonadota bacterium]|nr:MFS transporter [Pseudomonadota bacterium]
MSKSETTVDAAFEALIIGDDGRACRDIPDSACREEPNNFFTHVSSLTLSKTSDGLIDPKLVLSWLMTSLGAPSFVIGLLVPVREAGALLPQMFTAGAIRSAGVRKYFWAGGAIGQGLSALGILASALTLSGAVAGWAILGCLAVLALSRSVCSVAYKDVLGKTVSKSRRGSATGMAGSVSAAFVIIFALLLITDVFERMDVVLYGLGLAGLFWIAGGLLFTTLQEESGAQDGGANAFKTAIENLSYLKSDAQLRLFILVRGLLTVTALAPPLMVAAASANGTNAFAGLGLLVLASSGASLLSSMVWGRLADKSSRKVLIFSAFGGAAALVATAVAAFTGLLETIWMLPVLMLALMISYEGVRLGRSTHLVDMADEETRASYTAISNTIIGFALLAGSVFGVLAGYLGNVVVLAVMAGFSAVGGILSLGLNEVQAE